MKAQDIVVICKILLKPDHNWRFSDISHELKMSQSEVHAALKRSSVSGLYYFAERKLMKSAFLEFLIYGLKYVFPVVLGPVTRGVPTAYSAKPLSDAIVSGENSAVVWPYVEGTMRGQSIKPLYSGVPQCSLKDPDFYKLMALIDALRLGKARERALAIDFIKDILQIKI